MKKLKTFKRILVGGVLGLLLTVNVSINVLAGTDPPIPHSPKPPTTVSIISEYEEIVYTIQDTEPPTPH